jgi:5-methyltetrahydropteroyltriglutamate--homocysteine methyltransferase
MAQIPESRIFPTQEIGSVAKPSWRVKGISNDSKINPQDVEEAERWGKALEIPDYSKLTDLLSARARSEHPPSEEEKDAIRNWSVLYVLRLFDRANLDRVYSGEQWRVEMYEHLVRNIGGFKLLGSVHSFDYKYFTKGAIVAPPTFKHPIHLSEFEFVKANTSKQVKIPITGPYTVVDWSFNEYYETELRKAHNPEKLPDLRRTYFDARRQFILELVRNVLRREISELIQHGAKWIQIDEPAITTRPDEEEMDLFVEATNELTSGFSGCSFSVHNCYSDYELLARYAPRLKDVKQLALEFANRDSTDLGTSIDDRPGYKVLESFEREGYTGGFGLGVSHVHDFSDKPGNGAILEGRSVIESPELIRDRIIVASNILKDPSRISVNPDCGLRTRTWEVTYEKLVAIEKGSQLARRGFS